MNKRKINKEKIDFTFGSDSKDDEFYIELRELKKDIYSFLSLATNDEEIEVFIGKGADAVVLNLTDLKYILATSKERLGKAKAEWKKTINENPEWK